MIQLGFSAPEPFQGPRVANGLFKVEAGSLITVENRPTRTLSEPDGICSSGVGQHPATALAPPLGRITPIPLKWTAKLPGSLVVGNMGDGALIGRSCPPTQCQKEEGVDRKC